MTTKNRTNFKKTIAVPNLANAEILAIRDNGQPQLYGIACTKSTPALLGYRKFMVVTMLLNDNIIDFEVQVSTPTTAMPLLNLDNPNDMESQIKQHINNLKMEIIIEPDLDFIIFAGIQQDGKIMNFDENNNVVPNFNDYFYYFDNNYLLRDYQVTFAKNINEALSLEHSPLNKAICSKLID